MKPKVLFSNPPWWEKSGDVWRTGVRAGSRWPFTYSTQTRPDFFSYGDYLPYPFFMGYATTYVRKYARAKVVFRDSIALRESMASYLQFIKNEQFDFIFIETATPSWPNDSQILNWIQQQSPNSKIVITGPITMTKSEEILEKFPVHACIQGEYEKNSVKVIEGGSGILAPDLLTEEEMNAAPFPYFDDVYWWRYWDCNPAGQQWPQIQMWTSRGCPFKCIFCVWPATMTGNDPDGTGMRTVRHYSQEYIKEMLADLATRYPVRCAYFDDDTFNLGNGHVMRMCEVMKYIGLPWSAMCRADTIKMETWKIMKESGCFGVKLGFESGNQWVVDHIVNKHLNLEKAKEVVFHLRELGMSVHGTFTFGLPGETQEQMADTKCFIESLPFTSFQASGTAEIEGTPLHSLREKGNLENYKGAKLNEQYQIHSDGAKKFNALIESFKQG